jgi:hypothetical protein
MKKSYNPKRKRDTTIRVTKEFVEILKDYQKVIQWYFENPGNILTTAEEDIFIRFLRKTFSYSHWINLEGVMRILVDSTQERKKMIEKRAELIEKDNV